MYYLFTLKGLNEVVFLFHNIFIFTNRFIELNLFECFSFYLSRNGIGKKAIKNNNDILSKQMDRSTVRPTDRDIYFAFLSL